MGAQKDNGKAVKKAVQDAVDLYGNNRAELIPILNEINRKVGYLPQAALEEVSQILKVPKSSVNSVSTFYQMLSTKPRGRHVIQFCESAPCHVVGGREVWQSLKDALQIDSDETTSDGKWTLITVSCLGVCGVGPVIVIDDDIHGNVEPSQVPEILSRYQ
jgi:NADH:ubiquinone oxidoreductase subunit E